MHLRLHQCQLSDLTMLIEISRTTFIDAFEKDNNPDDFRAYIAFAFKKEKLLRELKNEGTAFYFVYKDADLVGYFKLNEMDAQTDIKAQNGLELERIYVLKKYQKQQVGQWILDEVKRIAAKKKKLFLWLGVWEHNLQAIRFYQRHGFSKFGTHPYHIGKDKQTDWMMRYELIS